MRRDFTFEDDERNEIRSAPGFADEFRAFLAEAISERRWHIWVAEVEGRVVAHVFVALVDKVPRPGHGNRRIAYLTNVYTRPAFRRQGIGAQLIKRAQDAASEADVELMIVWPGDESVEFYKRLGFATSDEPLIWDA